MCNVIQKENKGGLSKKLKNGMEGEWPNYAVEFWGLEV
jgi:hypothetical protein